MARSSVVNSIGISVCVSTFAGTNGLVTNDSNGLVRIESSSSVVVDRLISKFFNLLAPDLLSKKSSAEARFGS